MSIASEITRLQTAKADLKTAIEGKGVTVAASATLDAYADLVDSIETGGGGGQNIYTSSTGLLYTPIMTIDISMERANGYDINELLNRYGQMPYLEELTLTGVARINNTNAFSSTNAQFPQTKFPLLKKLHIVPTEMRAANGSETDKQYVSFGHYVFNGTNLTKLTIGRLNGPYYYGGGYFRNELPNPPTSNKYAVGSVDGLTIEIYVNAYKTPAAGFMSSLAPNTTVIQYDYLTGEVLTE